MPTPKADPVPCDVLGCGHLASHCTDGKEKDVQDLGRKAIPNLNVCDHHMNWPHSDDARTFATGDRYRGRK